MANEFKPTVGGKVPKTQADEWIKKYDDRRRPDKKKDTKSVFFGKDVLQEILRTDGAAGISIFLALKHSTHAGKDVESFVLVPTKEDGTLIWGAATSGKDDPEPYGWDDGAVCPPVCPSGAGG